MQSDLGYGAVQKDVHLEGPSNERETVDVRGERWSIHARRLQSTGSLVFGGAILLENMTSLREAVFVSPNVLLGVSIVVLATAYALKRRTREYAWVSCRNRKKPLSPGEVQELRDAVDAYVCHGAGRWKPTEIILVSNEAGFEARAVELARTLQIQCYRRIDATFEPVI
jgi:hypothetical protein